MGKPPMAFYHEKGLVPTWHLAQQYLGVEGHIATLPDIIDARLATEPGQVPWERYFTTTTAEYLGRSPKGNLILIVAHGIGPMAALDGIMAAYKHEYGDKSRQNSGGTISEIEFRKLEAGDYGEVFTVDLADYTRRYRYPFLSKLTAEELLSDPLLHARLGGEERAHRYVEWHRRHAAEWHQQEAGHDPDDHFGLRDIDPDAYERAMDRRQRQHLLDRENPFLLQNADANYKRRPPEDGMATARLLSIGSLAHVHHADERVQHESLACEIGVFDWWNGCRFVAVPAGVKVDMIHPGWNPRKMLTERWEALMVRLPRKARVTGLRPLMQLGETWFAQYLSRGHSMATGEPEFLVTEIEPVGRPVKFKTEIRGYYGIFRYAIQDVKAVAPPGANGFVMGEPEIIHNEGEPEYHTASVQFYRVKLDTSLRLRRRKDLEDDFEVQQKLLAQDAA